MTWRARSSAGTSSWASSACRRSRRSTATASAAWSTSPYGKASRPGRTSSSACAASTAATRTRCTSSTRWAWTTCPARRSACRSPAWRRAARRSPRKAPPAGRKEYVPGYDECATARWVAEPPKRAGRSDFERDRARVLHSAALRRLAAKTQVVRATSADFPRTRLTHSLECAQIGRELGQEIGCDPDLVDAACLAHDIGHSPFGHNGEAALNELALAIGGFEGNAQTLRLLTRLEPKTEGAGLNLTRATLDATLKYPWFGEPGTKFGAYAEDAEVFGWIRQGAPDRRPCLEAQVMDWADDVAYSVHDMEDGFHAGLITFKNLKSETERAEVSRTALAYCPGGVTEAELTEILDALLALDIWPASYDGAPGTVAALKNLTSELIGRFCVAAQQATLAAASESAPHPTTATPHPAPTPTSTTPTPTPTSTSTSDLASPSSHTSPIGHSFTRYAADLVVPR